MKHDHLKFELMYAIVRMQLLEAKKLLSDIESNANGKAGPLKIIQGGGQSTPRGNEHLTLVDQIS